MNSSPQAEPPLWITILAGGIGSRFWPASTPTRPKPLLPLASTRPLILDTVDRALGLVPPERLRIITSEHLVPAYEAELPMLSSENYWIEPRARGTGPALAWAAYRIREIEPESVLASLHSDHLIEPDRAFSDLLRTAANLASREDLLLTVAAPPDRPEPAYGYLRPGESLATDGGEGFKIASFVEKPDEETAAEYVRLGYLWNTGIFLLPVSRFIDELTAHAPEIGKHFGSLDRGDPAAFFDSVQPISVDEGVFERSDRVGAVRATFRWDDVGSWEALTRTLDGDDAGNRAVGQAHLVDTRDSVVWAEDGAVVLFGVSDVVAVSSGGITLVTSRKRSVKLKDLLDDLSRELREGHAVAGTANTGRAPENTD